MWGTEDLDYVTCGAMRSQTMWHVGHRGFGLCDMWGIEDSDDVACGALRIRTMRHVGH